MKHFSLWPLLLWITLASTASTAYGFADQPITTDSRIRTLVYNENEVFPLTLHYGYQASIEFAKAEEVETISVGNSYAIQVTPVKNRLFLKSYEENAHTNMTVITNKRTYQFDVFSKEPTNDVDSRLVYVIRFYYPEPQRDGPGYVPTIYSSMGTPAPVSSYGAPRRASRPASRSGGRMAPMQDRLESPYGEDRMYQPAPRYNFQYTLSGPDELAPVRVFDDGRTTYMKFSRYIRRMPDISIPTGKGKKGEPVSATHQGEYIVIDQVSKEWTLQFGRDAVSIYNEASSAQ